MPVCGVGSQPTVSSPRRLER